MGSRVVIIVSILMSLLLAADSQAGSKKCMDLIQELQAMQKAQHQLLQSFSQKNGMVAETLDQHADQLQMKMSRQGKLKKSDIQGLRLSAKAFRSHESKEENLVERFERASQQLFDQVQSCLENKSDIASLQN